MNFQKKKERFRFLGLGTRDIVKYFFGGNASLAIFILILIAVFLLREAWQFFPDHHRQFKTSRMVGLEYFSRVDESYQKYKVDTDALSRAFQAEVALPNRQNQDILSAHDAVRLEAERLLGDDLLVLKDALNQRKNGSDDDSDKVTRLDAVIEKFIAKIDSRRAKVKAKLTKRRVRDLRKLTAQDREKVVDAVMGIRFWEAGEESGFRRAVRAQFDEVNANATEATRQLGDAVLLFKNQITTPLDAVWKEASDHALKTRQRAESNKSLPREILDQVNEALATDSVSIRREKFGTVLSEIAKAEFFNEFGRIFYLESFSNILKNLQPDGSAYASIPIEVRQDCESILNSAVGSKAAFLATFRNKNREMDAILKAIPPDAMDQELRTFLFSLTRLPEGSDATIRKLSEEIGVFVEDFPFHEEAKTLHALTPRFREAVAEMKEKGTAALSSLPDRSKLKTKEARREVANFKKQFEKNIADLEKNGEKAGELETRSALVVSGDPGGVLFREKLDQ